MNPLPTHIGHRAAAKIRLPAPQIKFVFAEWLLRRAAKPQLPVESLCVNRLAIFPGVVVLPPIRPYLRNATQATAPYQVYRVAKVSPAALLHSALQNLLAGADCFD